MNEYDLAVQDFRIATTVEEADRIVTAFKVAFSYFILITYAA